MGTTFLPSNLKKSLKYFPFFLTVFFFILLLNIIGLIPYSSTATSYFSVTLILTLIIIIGAYFTVFSLHGLKFFSLLSLSARLAANMLAGHTLLAVIATFGFNMFNSADYKIILFGTLPLAAIFILFALETFVAMIQSLIFTILSCIYMDEAVHLSH